MSAPTYADDLTIPARFCGPPRSGNGGYTSGALAARVLEQHDPSAVEVTLRQPPPLDVAMTVQHVIADDPSNVGVSPATWLLLGGAKIAEARLVDVDLEPVEAVDERAAEAARVNFPGLRSHPFPTCFACGTDRAEGDGLRIFPGPVTEGRLAATWTPTAGLAEQEPVTDLRDEPRRVGLGTAWAALDCIGGWAGDMEERKMVLGRMTALVDEPPAVGETHVVVGRPLGKEGRKTFTASTIYDSDGRIVARAEHVWIAVDPSAFS